MRSPSKDVHEAAAQGIATPSTTLPHQEQIQASFGPQYDVSAIHAHVGGISAAACGDLGATAFATGDHVAFASAPDVHTAAHEAAHVIQQARGVNFYGGVGVAGDVFEQHADAVADRVAAGTSAEDLLSQSPPMVSGGVNRQSENTSTGVTETPYLETTPALVYFGDVLVGRPANVSVTVKNLGSDVMLGDIVTSGSGAFHAAIFGRTTLETGQTTTMTVGFRPTATGTQTASVAILNEDGVRGTDVAVVGTGVAGPSASPDAGKGKGTGKVDDAQSATNPTGADTVDVMPPLPIEAKPPVLDFDKVEDEVDALLYLENVSDQPAVIESAEVINGGNAFSVQMLSAKTLSPGEVAHLAVEYHPGPHAIDGAFLAIALTTGQRLFVTITAPAKDRALAATKAGVLKISPNPLIFADVDAPSSKSQSGGQAWADITITNPSLVPQEIDHIRFDNDHSRFASTADFRTESWKPMTVAPGTTAIVNIGLVASTPGDFAATGVLMTADDRAIGAFQLEAHAEATDWMDDPQKNAFAAADKTWKRTKNPRVLQARIDAKTALQQLQSNAGTTLTKAMESLRDEWLEYLRITASNPSISSEGLGGESLLGQVLEHTLAGGVAKTAEHVIEHMAHAGHAAGHAVGEVAGHTAEEAVGTIAGHAVTHAAEGVAVEAEAEVGLLIGSAVIGFAVGVLIETVGGLIYRWLSAEDEEIRKKLEEAWREGYQAGKDDLYNAFKAKTEQLDLAERKASVYQTREELAYEQLIGSTTDPKKSAQIQAEIQAQADLADPATAKIEKGLTKLLLQRWVRDHAADSTHGAKDVQQEDWFEATRGATDEHDPAAAQYWVGKLRDMPDLFVDQAIHEWTDRKLKPSGNLGDTMRAEIGMTPGQPQTDPMQAERIAGVATSVFAHREFVFQQGYIDYFLKMPWTQNVKTVSCYLDLQNRGGTCFVKQFIYLLEMDDGKVVRGTTAPGGGPLEVESSDTPAEVTSSKASANLYGFLTEIQTRGLHVIQQSGDAGGFLRETFGEDVEIATIQPGTGAEASIKIFHVLDGVVVTDDKTDVGADEKAVPYDLLSRLEASEMRQNGPYLMIRGGDTIVWMKVRRPNKSNP